MKRVRLIGCAWLAATSLAAGPAFADPTDSTGDSSKAADRKDSFSSLEISGAFGPTIMSGEPANPEYVQSFHRTGAFGEFAVAYRSSYFLDPYLGVGYATLASGTSQLPAGAYGAGGRLDQHLGAWTISPGITTQIWRFRPRLGLGLAVIVQTYGFLGEEHSTTELPVSAQLGLGFNAYEDDWFRFDVETRAILAEGADVRFYTLDLVLRGDVLHF
jgi:hypothetical protein